MPVDEGVVQSLRDKAAFRECLGREKNYPNFLEFFQREIEAKGVERVLRDYVFAGDERAESMLARLFGGMLLPSLFLFWVFFVRYYVGTNEDRPPPPNHPPRFCNRVQPTGYHCRSSRANRHSRRLDRPEIPLAS